eukprot:1443238-Rhodomonas_salina.1
MSTTLGGQFDRLKRLQGSTGASSTHALSRADLQHQATQHILLLSDLLSPTNLAHNQVHLTTFSQQHTHLPNSNPLTRSQRTAPAAPGPSPPARAPSPAPSSAPPNVCSLPCRSHCPPPIPAASTSRASPGSTVRLLLLLLLLLHFERAAAQAGSPRCLETV